jgi:hypothetical protein
MSRASTLMSPAIRQGSTGHCHQRSRPRQARGMPTGGAAAGLLIFLAGGPPPPATRWAKDSESCQRRSTEGPSSAKSCWDARPTRTVRTCLQNDLQTASPLASLYRRPKNIFSDLTAAALPALACPLVTLGSFALGDVSGSGPKFTTMKLSTSCASVE